MYFSHFNATATRQLAECAGFDIASISFLLTFVAVAALAIAGMSTAAALRSGRAPS